MFNAKNKEVKYWSCGLQNLSRNANLLSLLGFAMWYREKQANGDNSLEFCRFFCRESIMRVESIWKLRKVIACVGISNDLLWFIEKPRDWRRLTTSWVFFTASSTVAARRRKSSRYIRTRMAFLLRNAATGFRLFRKNSGGWTRMLLIPGTGNGEPGTRVWEQVYSGNPLENSKWRSKQKKRLEEKQFGLRRLERVFFGCYSVFETMKDT